MFRSRNKRDFSGKVVESPGPSQESFDEGWNERQRIPAFGRVGKPKAVCPPYVLVSPMRTFSLKVLSGKLGTKRRFKAALLFAGLTFLAGMPVAMGATVDDESKPEPRASSHPVIPSHRDGRSSGDVSGMENAICDQNGRRLVRDRVQGSGVIANPGTDVYQGVISPGHSPGCITNEGNVVFDASSTLTMEIGGTTACTGYDHFTVGQSLTLNGATLQLVLLNGYVPSAGQSFQILQWGVRTGTFGQVDTSLASLPSGYSWNLSQLYLSGTVSVSGPPSPAQVPWPSWALLALGCGLVSMMRFQRQWGGSRKARLMRFMFYRIRLGFCLVKFGYPETVAMTKARFLITHAYRSNQSRNQRPVHGANPCRFPSVPG